MGNIETNHGDPLVRGRAQAIGAIDRVRDDEGVRVGEFLRDGVVIPVRTTSGKAGGSVNELNRSLLTINHDADGGGIEGGKHSVASNRF